MVIRELFAPRFQPSLILDASFALGLYAMGEYDLVLAWIGTDAILDEQYVIAPVLCKAVLENGKVHVRKPFK
jgi:hypothetical protein